MSRKSPGEKSTDVQEAKGAAQAAIGKLIGDDTEVRKGREKQAEAVLDAPPPEKGRK